MIVIGNTTVRGINKNKKKKQRTVAETVEASFGDAQLFAAVNDLESQRFLVRASGWALENPQYLSSVSLNMAVSISNLLSFDLTAHLH